MRRKLVSLLMSAIVVYVLLGFILYTMQRQFIYSPTPIIDYAGAKRVTFSSDDQTINVWRVNPDKKHAILYFGGNVEQVGANISNFQNHLSQHTTYLVNYRGYSGSSGKPSETANYEDAINIFDSIKTNYSTVSVIGRSLGSGIATYLAVRREVENLVLVTPYDSIVSIAQSRYPIYPVSLMLKDKYDSASRAHKIDSRTLVIIAQYDEIIPPESSLRLVDRLSSKYTTTKIIEGVSHNNINIRGDYSRVLSAFFNEGKS